MGAEPSVREGNYCAIAKDSIRQGVPRHFNGICFIRNECLANGRGQLLKPTPCVGFDWEKERHRLQSPTGDEHKGKAKAKKALNQGEEREEIYKGDTEVPHKSRKKGVIQSYEIFGNSIIS